MSAMALRANSLKAIAAARRRPPMMLGEGHWVKAAAALGAQERPNTAGVDPNTAGEEGNSF